LQRLVIRGQSSDLFLELRDLRLLAVLARRLSLLDIVELSFGYFKLLLGFFSLLCGTLEKTRDGLGLLHFSLDARLKLFNFELMLGLGFFKFCLDSTFCLLALLSQIGLKALLNRCDFSVMLCLQRLL
jgi:hypothetical protein